jgi:hypothetical protein
MLTTKPNLVFHGGDYGKICSLWSSDEAASFEGNMSEIVSLMLHSQSVLPVTWELWSVYTEE